MTEPSADAAIEWLLLESHNVRFLEDVLARVCELLREGGLPLERVTIHLRALHPQFRAVALRWRVDLESVELVRISAEALTSEAFLNSPVRALFEGAEGLRQRLDIELPPGTYGVYHDLKEAGFSDYAALPLILTNGQRLGSSWTTRRPGGWRTEELIEIGRLRPLLAMAAEIRIARRISRNIADTYLGRRAADLVLDGRISRGDMEIIEAAILVLDMRGYTALTERYPSDAVFARLNRFFDVFGAPVEQGDGEILKFLGDGMLVIFKTEDGAEAAAARAFDAAQAGLAGLRELNAELAAAGEAPIGCGLGLHLGEVAFGNFGTESRLDFTVIGPAVNLAARLEQLTKTLGEPFILSAQAAAAAGRPIRRLGEHVVRGVAQPVAIFAPATT